MGLLEAVVVLSVVGMIVYAVVTLLTRGAEKPRIMPGAAGSWQPAHYEVGAATRIVVRKVLPDGATVVDEHLVATVAEADPDYDAKFLEAMAIARQRVALFESEEE
ncbi:MAG: hypothetical protein ACXV2J_01325 [Actinomycetes bacterium]